MASSRPSNRVYKVKIYFVFGFRPVSTELVVLLGKDRLWTGPPEAQKNSEQGSTFSHSIYNISAVYAFYFYLKLGYNRIQN